MDRETNIESIRALEKQIDEHHDKRARIHLKRVRNSLLNISTLPPEILGDIFHRNVIPKQTFDAGLVKGSYNFLLVCHHWFEVASRTPELWSFWGNGLQDWAKRHVHSQAGPLDLVLDWTRFNPGSLDAAVRKSLQDHAARDTVRQVHIRTEDSKLLDAILSSLAAHCDGLRTNSLESFVLWNQGGTPADVSDFFAHYRFPKLRRLALSNCTISSWDHLTSRTTLLTTLQLTLDKIPPPTASQLFSMLTSNPQLEELTLAEGVIPVDDNVAPSFRVPFRRLKRFALAGNLSHLFRLLRQLECPERMDYLSIVAHDCTAPDIPRTIGPYLQDYIGRRGKSRKGLDIFLTYDTGITLHASDVGESPSSIMPAFVRIIVVLKKAPIIEELEKLNLDLVSHVPLGEVVSFRVIEAPVVVTDFYARLPSLEVLKLDTALMSAAFPEPDQGALRVYDQVSPSLRHLSLAWLLLDDYDWSPLTAFLSYRASAGNPIGSLTLLDPPHMCPEVVESIKGVVEEVRIDGMVLWCPLGRC